MKPSDLKKWMLQHDKNATDVASMAGVDSKTVTRFLKGETNPQPIVLRAFKKVVESDSPEQPRVL